ncbi:MAG: hypothetical protein ACPLRZ_02700 [Thermovenabulum sp.]|uniref:hypothetical protein n=1 Tax=Thermovenabulum sp. TaxID=3100335 RepID=UPI003C7ED534
MKHQKTDKGKFILGRYFKNGENMVGHLSEKTKRLALYLERKAYLEEKQREKGKE